MSAVLDDRRLKFLEKRPPETKEPSRPCWRPRYDGTTEVVSKDPLWESSGSGDTSPKTQSAEVTRRLLRILVDAPSASINFLRRKLREESNPQLILDAALDQFRQTGRADYIEFACSLLEDFRAEAWPALRSLARSGVPECEWFVGVIARCKDISPASRLRAMEDLAANSDRNVRARIFDVLSEFPVDERRGLLQKLTGDVDPDVSSQAYDLLAFMDA